jgi:L-alanine-DL-glutamate epimerase-like enolase superfamily enzyme
MKIGAEITQDVERVKSARSAIGKDAALFVDANGGYTVKQAEAQAAGFEPYNVSWFEEPVPSDDLAGLAYLRNQMPPGTNVAAGEYGYNLPYFEKMMSAGAVDILQGDATRCGGITGFLKAGHLCEAHGLPYSSHCAPAMHLHAALSLPAFYIAEYFHDHARIEQLFFDGAAVLENGCLMPDLSRPGMGLELKIKDVEKYRL